MKINFIGMLLVVFSVFSFSHDAHQTKGSFEDKFRQLEEKYPDPNQYRPATGEPGKLYWQQQADYKISIILNEDNRSLSGSEVITYKNNSPSRSSIYLGAVRSKYI